MNNKYRVLLCGTKYGKAYLPSIFESDNLDLVGILASGSLRSLKMADQSGVPLFSTVEEINIEIDCACVAIGSESGLEIALKLLSRKIPVLIEHPITDHSYRRLCQVATTYSTNVYINTHFTYLSSISDFIVSNQRMLKRDSPIVVQGACNSRTLFSMLEILSRIFGVKILSTISISEIPGNNNYYQLNFKFGNTPFAVNYQAWRKSVDDSTDSPLGHQCSVTYPQGVLSLCGTYGPCIWHPLISAAVPLNCPIFGFVEKHNKLQYLPTVADIIEDRKKANRNAICDLLRASGDSAYRSIYQPSEMMGEVCKTWKWLSDRIANPIKDFTESRLDKKYWLADTV